MRFSIEYYEIEYWVLWDWVLTGIKRLWDWETTHPMPQGAPERRGFCQPLWGREGGVPSFETAGISFTTLWGQGGISAECCPRQLTQQNQEINPSFCHSRWGVSVRLKNSQLGINFPCSWSRALWSVSGPFRLSSPPMTGSLVLVLSKLPPQSRGPSHQFVLTTGPLLLDLVHLRIKHSTVLPWQLPFLSLPPPPPPFSYPTLQRPLPDFPPFSSVAPFKKVAYTPVSIFTKMNNNTFLALLEAIVLFLVVSNLKKQVHNVCDTSLCKP